MPLSRIAYLCAWLAIVVVHGSWLLGASIGHLRWCNPYWSYCHSISATGRQYPEALLFKGGMLIAAVAMLVYWWLLRYWMTQLGCARQITRAIVLLGMLSCPALILYTLTLGLDDQHYGLARRTGIIVFFALSAFAHLLLVNALLPQVTGHVRLASSVKNLMMLCGFLLFIGLLSALTGYLWLGYQYWQNAFEWWFALLMMGQFLLVGSMWRQTDYRLTLSLGDLGS